MGADFAKSRKEIGVAAAQPISIYMPFSSQVGMNCYFFIPTMQEINLCSGNSQLNHFWKNETAADSMVARLLLLHNNIKIQKLRKKWKQCPELGFLVFGSKSVSYRHFSDIRKYAFINAFFLF